MRSTDHWARRLALDAAAGFAGSLALQVVRTATQEWQPATLPPFREDPGEFMVEAAEEMPPDDARRHIPAWAEATAAQGLAVGYGLTFGSLYAAVRPAGGPPLSHGIALGLSTWAAGYLGWLSALGLMPPVWRQDPEQVVLPVVQHAVYGVATVASYDWLTRRVDQLGVSRRRSATSALTSSLSTG